MRVLKRISRYRPIPIRPCWRRAISPVHALPADPGILETLERWGVRTVGELAELPEIGFVARFGEAGERLLRLARGTARRSMRAVQPPETYERHIELEHPQALLEPLLFVLSPALEELMDALGRRSLAANRVTLGLKLTNKTTHQRTLEFPVPVRDAKVILKQLQFDLEAHPPKAAILAIGVRLNPAEPRTLQHGLFVPQAPAPEKLQMTLARLTVLMGEANVGSPELLDTHRPDAFVMRAFSPEGRSASAVPAAAGREKKSGGTSALKRSGFADANPECPRFLPAAGVPSAALRFAFRYYRPALAAQVRIKAERPAAVAAVDKGAEVKGDVVQAAGPWRASGDWWTRDAWQRDEWDLELSNGGIYRVYAVPVAGPAPAKWFVEGMYD
jgi:protein ImuB